MAGVSRALVAAAALTLFSVILSIEAQIAPVSCAMRSNTSCTECLKNVTCMWCKPTKKCIDYPLRNAMPTPSMCPLDGARWAFCWLNFKILLIIGSVLACIILICIIVVCCCCCCKCQRSGSGREAESVEEQTRESYSGAQRRF